MFLVVYDFWELDVWKQDGMHHAIGYIYFTSIFMHRNVCLNFLYVTLDHPFRWILFTSVRMQKNSGNEISIIKNILCNRVSSKIGNSNCCYVWINIEIASYNFMCIIHIFSNKYLQSLKYVVQKMTCYELVEVQFSRSLWKCLQLKWMSK